MIEWMLFGWLLIALVGYVSAPGWPASKILAIATLVCAALYCLGIVPLPVCVRMR